MKLPISLLVLVALSQALSVQPLTKRSEANSSVVEIPVSESSPAKSSSSKSSPAKSPVAKSSADKQKDDNQTSKRELYEGNFGERNKEVVSKYEVTGPTPKIEYENELQDMISEQSPAHQIFGLRMPQIAKISDVLSGHGPSFEAALAKHLYSPVSVYQARLSSPTSFEVPTPAASQSPYSDPKAYKLQADAENEQNQATPPKGVELPRPVIAVYMMNQPRHEFEAYPQPLDSGLSRQHANLPQEIFRPNQLPKKVMSSLFPIYDQLGPFRHPGQEVPSQILHQNGVYQIVPVRTDFGFGNQEGKRDKNYSKQENHDQLKAGQPKLQIEIPVPKQGYHAHPNGAISFASFSHNLPVRTQYETGPPTQQAQLQSQAIPVQQPPQIQPEVMLQSQEQKLAPVKQKLLIPSMFQRLIQDLQNYEPVYRQQPQFIPFKQLIQNQPRNLNALQQHLLFQDPRQLPNPQLIQLQRLPAFKPLPQSLLSAESFLQQQTSRSPVISERSPRPFSYEDHSKQNPENFDLPLEPASTQLTPLPPLKPNYSKYVKPLEPHPHTTPIFLPTQLQPLSTSTPKLQLVSDQLISSTTIQPNVKGQEDPKEQSIQKETQPQSQISQSLKPEITHQSQPTVRAAPIQSTTYLPFVTHEPHSIYFQYSTPQPVYQASIRPSSPRHDVVIQRQEIQELFFDPSPQLSSTPHNQNQHQVAYQQEQEVHQLRTQPHHQLFEQLQPLQFQHEMQDINSQQYQLKARQSKYPQKQDSSQQGGHLQDLIQQHSHPVQLQHFQPKLLQSQQSELAQLQQQQLVYQAQQQTSEQAQQQQQASEQAQQQQQQASEQAQLQQQASEQAQQQQQQASEQAQQQQQQASEQAQLQQQASEQAQEQQQASEQAQQQQQASEQAQQQQQESEQAQQQQESEQAQQQQESEQAQQQQGSEQAQQEYQHHLDTNNQIQISTLKPSQDAEKQTDTVEILQQPESQPLQQQSDLQPTTGKPKEQSDHLSEPTPNVEQPYVGPLLTSSELPQIYAHQQQLVAQPEHSPLLGVPSYSDVQYFGKFAESIFGNHHH